MKIQNSFNYFNSNFVTSFKESRIGSLISQNKKVLLVAAAVISALALIYAIYYYGFKHVKIKYANAEFEGSIGLNGKWKTGQIKMDFFKDNPDLTGKIIAVTNIAKGQWNKVFNITVPQVPDASMELDLGEYPTIKHKLGYAGNMTEYGTVNGEKHGPYKHTYTDGDVLTENWDHGRLKGLSTLTYANGDIYKGTVIRIDGTSVLIVKKERQGHGQLIFKNGDILEGTWVDDKLEGVVKFTEKSSGVVYEGQWMSNPEYTEGSKDIPKGWIEFPVSHTKFPIMGSSV